jgi:hypothetical protein
MISILFAVAAGALEAQTAAVFSAYDRPGSPGCAVGVYRDGVVGYAKGFGVANLDHGVPITPDTVFYVGSVSNFPDEPRVPLARDAFRSSLGTLRFERAASGQVTGFLVSTDRSRNLRFRKAAGREVLEAGAR